MKKLFTLITITALAITFATAQVVAPVKGNGKITGSIIDTETNLPVEFANVALIDPKTGKPVDGAVADAKGKFTIVKIAAGTYHVAISFIGYETKTIENVDLTDKKNIELGTIKLPSEAKVLSEIIVEGQKQLIEERVDRTVYNAENDKTTAGGDATDVLRRVPLLSVDLDGNVSLRGNSNLRVLINNKPSIIAASSVADALKQIPADQIKSVEVITSPSAKYDAEGSSGIINIITKKNTLQGATLGVDLGTGLRGSNLGLNGSYRKGKMGFSLGGHGRAGYNINGAFINDQVTLNKLTRQEAETRRNDFGGRYQLGWDYDINKLNSLTASARIGGRNGTNYQDGLTSTTFLNNIITSSSLRDVKTVDNNNNLDVNLDYTRLFEKPQKEFSISSQYSRNNRTNDFFNTIYGLNEDIFQRRKNENESYNEEATLQLDYQTPIQKNQLIEFGAKHINRKVSSDFRYLQADGPDGEFLPSLNIGQSGNIFNYNQNVTGSYVSYTLNLNNSYSIKAGTRYEHTTITANFQNPTEGENPTIPSYGNVVPSINLSKKLKGGNTLKAAYNRRIQRPSIQFLNPNIQNPNPFSETIGNPELEPELTDNYELSYSTFIKGSSINVSSFIRNTSGAIQSLREVVRDSVIRTTYVNLGIENAYGLSLNGNVNIGKLSLNGGTDAYYAVLSNNAPVEQDLVQNEGWVINGRLFGNYKLKNNWGFQFFSFLRGRQVQLQGWQGGFGMYSLGLRKEFNNKRGSIGFGAENFLHTSIKVRSELTSNSINQKSVNEMRNMSFRVNISYRFGKMSFDAPRPRRKKSVNNDDLKDGGGDGGGGGMDNANAGGNQAGQRNGAANAGGQKPQVVAKPVAADTTKADPNVVVKADGNWTYTVESPQGGGGVLKITKTGDAYSGVIINSRNNREVVLKTVSVKGNEMTFTYENNFGGNTMEVSAKGIIAGDTFAGTMTMGQFGSFPIKAKRSE
jgi:outer membrane receptor protein involved in Fe transport